MANLERWIRKKGTEPTDANFINILWRNLRPLPNKLVHFDNIARDGWTVQLILVRQ